VKRFKPTAIAGLLMISLVSFRVHSVFSEDRFDSVLQHDLQFARQQLTVTSGALPLTSYPFTTAPTGEWETNPASSWSSGFFPGSLWHVYQATGDPRWRIWAEARQAGIESQKYNTSTHDIGFMIFNSFGSGYRLTGNDAFRQVTLKAAQSLAKRYSTTVGCIRSWNSSPGEFKVIIDNLMTLELLFWTARQGGDHALYDMAVSHALKTRANHVRTDGSTYQLVNYDPLTGAVIGRGTVQGYSDESTWSRGQAWAVYGFTMIYRETGDTRFLSTARKTADYYLSHLPSDSVPYWDFNVPYIPGEPRDSSAAAIAASGLLELSQLETDASRKSTYSTGAKSTLSSLSSANYLAEGTSNQAILLHGTHYKPKGRYDTGLIWGDYYFLEAMLRCRRLKPTSSPLAVASVSASSDDGHIPSNTLDNDLNTRWSANGNGQWISYDLGLNVTVAKVGVAFYQGDQRTARFDIQASQDGSNWRTVFSGLSSGMTRHIESYDFTDRTARFLRVVGHGNSRSSWTSITEVRIFRG
jgi:unsaturated chondroitin disaccharide hydrolase